MILLDTNVVSEFMRPRPDPTVVAWLDGIQRTQICTASVVVAEISAGIALLPAGSRRDQLIAGLGQAVDEFGPRILSFTTSTAAHYGQIIARRTSAGRPISIADAQIAATAIEAGATLATRNLRDFEGIDVTLIDPWSAE